MLDASFDCLSNVSRWTTGSTNASSWQDLSDHCFSDLNKPATQANLRVEKDKALAQVRYFTQASETVDEDMVFAAFYSRQEPEAVPRSQENSKISWQRHYNPHNRTHSVSHSVRANGTVSSEFTRYMRSLGVLSKDTLTTTGGGGSGHNCFALIRDVI